MSKEFRGKLILVRARLDEWLFPDAAPTASGLGRGEQAVVLGAAFALLLIAELVRPGLAGSLDTVWAEDGSVILGNAINHGFFHEVFTVYPEYLIVVPRLIGAVATWFPLRDAAVVITVLSSAITALSGIVVWFAASTHVRNPYLRAVLVIVVVLAPAAGLEAVASAVYVSWYMMAASFWILFYRPRTDWGAALAALFLLFAALSNPGVWFFAPIAGLRLMAARDRRDAMILASYTVGAGAQAIAALQHPSEVPAEWSAKIWTVYLQRVLDGSVLGLRWGGDVWASLGWTLLIGLIVLSVAVLVAGLWRARAAARLVALLAIAISLLSFIVSMYQRQAAPALFWPAHLHPEVGGRYAIVPAILLVVAIFVLIDDWLDRGAPALWARLSVVGVAMLVPLIAVASSFYIEETVARGAIHWTSAIDTAETICEQQHLPEVPVMTSPPGFGVAVPCESLVSGSAQPAAGTQ